MVLIHDTYWCSFAIIYINPEAWLNDVLEKIPSASILELEKLLPQNFNLTDGGN